MTLHKIRFLSTSIRLQPVCAEKGGTIPIVSPTVFIQVPKGSDRVTMWAPSTAPPSPPPPTPSLNLRRRPRPTFKTDFETTAMVQSRQKSTRTRCSTTPKTTTNNTCKRIPVDTAGCVEQKSAVHCPRKDEVGEAITNGPIYV